ncbi:sensor histidine kinase [Mycobacterium sp. DL592]|uniref:sensor histidine kinase n=1 Tax=Mycobacterium sp. DL592 TaxID=2675524 RepID=UPI00141FC397|nr:DUF4118 domain-containing protein [Mycobacterium sp. DL592]
MSAVPASPTTDDNPFGIRAALRSAFLRGRPPSAALGFAIAAGLIVVETFALVLFKSQYAEAFAALFLVGVVVTAALWGIGLGLFAAAASAMALNILLSDLADTQSVQRMNALLVFVFFAVVAVVTSKVVGRQSWEIKDAAAEQRWSSLGNVARQHQIRRLRVASIFRVGTVAILISTALLQAPSAHPLAQKVLLGCYAAAAISAFVVAFHPGGPATLTPERLLVFALADVSVVFGFQLVSAGGPLPLLVLALAPFIVVPEVSWRGAAVVLVIVNAAFVVALLREGSVTEALGPLQTALVISVYTAFCFIGFVAAYLAENHFGEIAELIGSREALLASTMTATDKLQREVAEAIHDGALQDIVVARQDLMELASASPDPRIDRALRSLEDATARLREAVFELHPVVVEQLGLGPAVEKLADDTARRSDIEIATFVDQTGPTAVDGIVFGVVRELLSNVVRHSGATSASVHLALVGDSYRLDVQDDGVGVDPAAAQEKVARGHIGLASHRARVEASNGVFEFIPVAVGTHVRVEVPLPRGQQAAGPSLKSTSAA